MKKNDFLYVIDDVNYWILRFKNDFGISEKNCFFVWNHRIYQLNKDLFLYRHEAIIALKSLCDEDRLRFSKKLEKIKISESKLQNSDDFGSLIIDKG